MCDPEIKKSELLSPYLSLCCFVHPPGQWWWQGRYIQFCLKPEAPLFETSSSIKFLGCWCQLCTTKKYIIRHKAHYSFLTDSWWKKLACLKFQLEKKKALETCLIKIWLFLMRYFLEKLYNNTYYEIYQLTQWYFI